MINKAPILIFFFYFIGESEKKIQNLNNELDKKNENESILNKKLNDLALQIDTQLLLKVKRIKSIYINYIIRYEKKKLF